MGTEGYAGFLSYNRHTLGWTDWEWSHICPGVMVSNKSFIYFEMAKWLKDHKLKTKVSRQRWRGYEQKWRHWLCWRGAACSSFACPIRKRSRRLMRSRCLCRMAVTTADLCILAAVQEHPVTCHVKKGMNWAWMAVVRYRAAEPTEPGIIFWKDGPRSLSDDFFHHQTRIKKKCPESLDCPNHQRR